LAGNASSGVGANAHGRLLSHLITWSVAAFAIYLWFDLGPDDPMVAVAVTGWTLNLGLVVVPLALRLPQGWLRIPPGERVLHRLLGVPAYGWLLDRSGWNRHVALPSRNCKVVRANLPRLQLTMRAAAEAHAIAFVPHLALAGFALATGHATGAAWIMLLGIVVHLYPVLLQRAMLLRLQPVLDASATGRSGRPPERACGR
jgi:hypothetical protein